ncbi:hypothetical protein GCM10023188_16610 [Pontibacter saemangeumensis]|uniref:YhhN-like protein n=1 Tax=Pontibacter saemangeumensis TaxID=1084525 RepID=A0ABP8LJZ8_9BACT
MEVFFSKYYYWLSYTSSFSVLVPLLASLILLKQFGRPGKVFWGVFLYIVFLAIVETLGFLSVYLWSGSNLWISYLYVPIEYALLSWIYYMSFEQKQIKSGIIISVIVFLLACIAEAFWGAGTHNMNSYSRVMESTILIALALLYLFVLYKDLNYVYLEQDPMFVLSCGVMIFFAGTAMAYGMFNKALAISDNMARVCMTITYVLNISFNCVLVLVQRRAVTA